MSPSLRHTCSHLRVERGIDTPRRYGSWRTQVCLDCAAFRTHDHGVQPDPAQPLVGSPWRSHLEYADAIASGDDE